MNRTHLLGRANRVVRLALLVVSLVLTAIFAAYVPAADGGLLPGGLVLLALSARALRRLTSPESRRA